MNFELTDRCRDFQERLGAFMEERIYPAEAVYEEQLAKSGDPHWHPPVMEELGSRTPSSAACWNLFHPDPDPEVGPGLSNVEYAPLAEISGRSPIAPEAINCAAPDTGNMGVLTEFGTPEQKERWLQPLLDGEIRSAFAMTEPDVASSDATNIRAPRSSVRASSTSLLCSTGASGGRRAAMRERCRIFIVMGKTTSEGPRHRQQSMVLVPRDTPGLAIVRNLPVFGYTDQEGHAELRFENARVPAWPT